MTLHTGFLAGSHRKANKITSAEMIALFKQLQASHPQATAICAVLDSLGLEPLGALVVLRQCCGAAHA
jgi:hypothetical protein